MTTFTGNGVNVFAATALKHGLMMYRDHKMIPNRMYTPTNMLKAAERITGKKFKRGQYSHAIRALEAWIDINSTRAVERGEIV